MKKPDHITDGEWRRWKAFVKKNEHGYLMWVGSKDPNGYGQFWFRSKRRSAHKVAYFIYHGTWPINTIDHTCERHDCVDKRCLEDVTQAVNNARSTKQKAWQQNNQFSQRTHCKYGHEYTIENTRIDKRGVRICKRCKADTAERLRQKARELNAERWRQAE